MTLFLFIDERMVLMRLKHTLGFISLIYAPTETYNPEEEMFYAKLESIVDQCPPRGTSIALDDFNAVTGTNRAGYEVCIGPRGSGTRNINNYFLLNFKNSRRLRFQRREPYRWTWYNSAGGVGKEIGHILVSTR
ncbi:uncharacterized protein LOC143024496 [Oratosquilla oratoria]|uniref:uncharacterized protein LOC143024496 n=1 Tax=Oratosquilla oratoria TaxID=337810 RepID=UPI003F7676B4